MHREEWSSCAESPNKRHCESAKGEANESTDESVETGGSSSSVVSCSTIDGVGLISFSSIMNSSDVLVLYTLGITLISSRVDVPMYSCLLYTSPSPRDQA
eukprot:TRINITY_DN6946_c0_g2_i4.p5 TRINITY_DN6946_c0_g2~~TRINITY_DN6946_c0_g2_i4.p5  ORF type:complete len:100 (+),score=18.76 TRINITY_DN6946_c0_g2_i4:1388-1687(+)